MYKIQKYEHLLESQDEDTRKRFDMVRKLSKEFTTENATARQLDDLLAEQMELESGSKGTSPSTPPRSAPRKPRKPAEAKPLESEADVKQAFAELFEALKNREDHTADLSPEELAEAVERVIRTSKIGFNDLDNEVQERLANKPRLIQYSIPTSPAPTDPTEKPDIAAFQSIVDDVIMGNNVMLIGGAGTGKTYLAENLVAKAALKRPYLTINCSQWTTPTEIVGGQTMDGYQEGKLIEAWKNGYILILDELPKIDPNTAGLLNDALAKTKKPDAIIFNSRRESFPKHPDFGCIATGNVYPDKESMAYGANNKQDLSLLDRFSGSVYLIEKNPQIERAIIQNDMIWSICDRLRSAIEELKYEAQMSLRFMQNARDSFVMEMQRVKEPGRTGIRAEEGKTFKGAVDSYLSTFTDVQKKNLKERIKYTEFVSRYQYRSMNQNTMLF